MNTTTTAPAAISLTRDEAVAVSNEMQWTSGDNMVDDDLGKRDLAYAAIRRLKLESALRDALGWWRPNDPGLLDVHAKIGEGECPESWAVPATAIGGLAELLPDLIAQVDDRIAQDPADRVWSEQRKRLLESVAARLAVA